MPRRTPRTSTTTPRSSASCAPSPRSRCAGRSRDSPPHYRDVLVLCEISELSYAEAAQVCGIDIGTVRSRLSRARAELARRLARYAQPAERATEAL